MFDFFFSISITIDRCRRSSQKLGTRLECLECQVCSRRRERQVCARRRVPNDGAAQPRLWVRKKFGAELRHLRRVHRNRKEFDNRKSDSESGLGWKRERSSYLSVLFFVFLFVGFLPICHSYLQFRYLERKSFVSNVTSYLKA
jgi:hypothetical protein